MDNNNNTNSAPNQSPNTETATIDVDQSPQANATPVKQENQPTAKEQKAELKRKLKELELKVDGKVVKESLPFEVDADNKEMVDYLTRQLQMAKGFHNRANYAKTLETEITEFFNNLKSDPLSVLSDPNIGLDIKEIVNAYAKRELENSKKTPEQLKAEELEKELAKVKKEREREQEELRKQKTEMLEKQAYAEYEQSIINAIEATTDLPKSAYVVRKFADMMLSAMEMGVKVTPEEIAPLVKKEVHADIKQMFEAAPDEVVESFFGKDRLAKLRKKNVDKALNTAPLKQVKDVGVQEEKPVVKKTYRDFFRS